MGIVRITGSLLNMLRVYCEISFTFVLLGGDGCPREKMKTKSGTVGEERRVVMVAHLFLAHFLVFFPVIFLMFLGAVTNLTTASAGLEFQLLGSWLLAESTFFDLC